MSVARCRCATCQARAFADPPVPPQKDGADGPPPDAAKKPVAPAPAAAPQGQQTYTVVAHDPDGTLFKLLNHIGKLGNGGHTFDIVVEGAKFNWDGDGADSIVSVKAGAPAAPPKDKSGAAPPKEGDAKAAPPDKGATPPSKQAGPPKPGTAAAPPKPSAPAAPKAKAGPPKPGASAAPPPKGGPVPKGATPAGPPAPPAGPKPAAPPAAAAKPPVAPGAPPAPGMPAPPAVAPDRGKLKAVLDALTPAEIAALAKMAADHPVANLPPAKPPIIQPMPKAALSAAPQPVAMSAPALALDKDEKGHGSYKRGDAPVTPMQKAVQDARATMKRGPALPAQKRLAPSVGGTLRAAASGIAQRIIHAAMDETTAAATSAAHPPNPNKVVAPKGSAPAPGKTIGAIVGAP